MWGSVGRGCVLGRGGMVMDDTARHGIAQVTTSLPLVLHCRFRSREEKEPTWLSKGSMGGFRVGDTEIWCLD